MGEQAARARFGGSPVIVGVIPGQGQPVWGRALELAGSWSVPLIAAFVDPASYLIEWTPGNQVLPISLDPVLDSPGHRRRPCPGLGPAGRRRERLHHRDRCPAAGFHGESR